MAPGDNWSGGEPSKCDHQLHLPLSTQLGRGVSYIYKNKRCHTAISKKHEMAVTPHNFHPLHHRGSAAANTISQYTLAIVIYVYIIWRGLHKATWDGESLTSEFSLY